MTMGIGLEIKGIRENSGFYCTRGNQDCCFKWDCFKDTDRVYNTLTNVYSKYFNRVFQVILHNNRKL